MKINAVITKKPRIKLQSVKLDFVNKTLFLIAGIIFLSIISGALIYKLKSEVIKASVFEIFVAFSTDVTGKSFFEAVSGFFAVDLSVLIILSILGTSAFGRVPILVVTAFRTLGIGALGAYLLDSFGVDGFKYYSIVILPGKAFMLFALLLSVQNCFQTSRKLKLYTLEKSNEKVDYNIYIARNSVALIIFALSALIDSLLLKYVSQYFLPNI